MKLLWIAPAHRLHPPHRRARLPVGEVVRDCVIDGVEDAPVGLKYAYLARARVGVALPSQLGDVMVYVAADAGHRKGIRGLTEEATIGVGVRLALGAAPP